MAFETFTPPGIVYLSPGSSEEFVPRVLKAGFGGNYAQRKPDGLNSLASNMSLVFSALEAWEAKALLDFFASKRGTIPFVFTPPGSTEPMQWVCSKWTRQWTHKSTCDVTAVFEQDFTPPS